MSYIEIRGLRKAFGAVQALSDATLSIERGTIHGLCGANGAGKSTLIRVLAGAVTPDSGEIVLDGQRLREFTPQHSTALGIGVVFQELALVPGLTVYQNIFLGIEQRRGLLPQTRAMKERAADVLARMGVRLRLEAAVDTLGLHQQQIVEIAKALCRGTALLILDEPTAILNPVEKQKLFGVLRELKKTGLCIIFITHFIDELFEVCDRLTVMRDGRTVRTCSIAETDRDEVITTMVGSAVDLKTSQPVQQDTRESVLSLQDGSIAGKFAHVNLAVRKGEIVGLAGLVGSGCYEVAETLFGLRQLDRGQIQLDGRPVHVRDPRFAAHAGIGYVPQDRRTQGLCLNLAASENIALPSLSETRFSRLGIVKTRSQVEAFKRIGSQLRLRPLDPRLPASGFSGGSQQKLVVGKWIEKGCRVYIFIEPTRGVDVGAKVEIWKIIEQLGVAGAAVILVSTDFDDIVATCSRCIVFTSGRISAELVGQQITVDRIAALAIDAKSAVA